MGERRGRREPARARVGPQVPLSGGDGLFVAVNANGGSADAALVEELRTRLPQAEIVEVMEPERLAPLLRSAADRIGISSIGVVGGDGTVNGAAAVAHEAGVPLVPIPGGTLNHLAGDLGLEDLEAVAVSVEAGTSALVDLPSIAGRRFLNTAAFGAYPELVEIRERFEGRLGKWPAMLLAAAKVLRNGIPIDVEVDGVHQRLWMIFVGNCAYGPGGFAPAKRERLDDGHLDVRSIDAAHPWSRTRLALGLVTGRLGRSPVYRQWLTTRLEVRSLGDPLRLACDGEIFEGTTDVVVEKDGTTLVLACAANVIS